jgi:hypothetical protein
MCILVLFYKRIPGYPLVLGANRDEYFDRPAAPPSIWQAEGGGSPFLAPRDLRAKGTWIGLNARGALAALTNRKSAPARDVAPSRGLLCSHVLSAGTSRDMVREGVEAAGRAGYNGFNLLAADREHAYLVRGGGRQVTCVGLEPGIHVLTNEHELNEVPLPSAETWAGPPPSEDALLTRLFALLKSHDPLSPDGFAPCKHFDGRGTRSATLIVFSERGVRFFHADGAPCTASFDDLSGMTAELMRT